MRDQIKRSAEDSGRSMNSEILEVLREAFPEDRSLEELIDALDYSPNEFLAWLKAMKISGAEAARLLGVNANTITRYKKQGAPKSVGLACAALYHRLKEWK
jgi:hypothetical protein